MISPMHKKLKSMPSAGKSMVTVFWDEEGVILGDLLLYLGICCCTWEFVTQGETSESSPSSYVFHKKNVCTVVLPDNIRPCVSVYTTGAITHFGWTLLPCQPYSPASEPSDYHVFDPLETSH